MSEKIKQNSRRKPDWLKIRLPHKEKFSSVNKAIKYNKLNTICTSGRCPNLGECWDRGTATIMILGDICTRSCKFCAVQSGKPKPVDKEQPRKVAESIQKLKLKHCVITSVDRDDLKDGGAGIWEETIKQIKKINPATTIETLIPDFNGDTKLIQQIIDAKPEVISHNLETVRRLTPQIRSKAQYDQSLAVVKYLSDAGIQSKSGIMAGLGETFHEVIQTMDDLRAAGCKVMTIGQYLQPTPKHATVKDYIPPEIFSQWKQIGQEKGFYFIESAPLVRSSYQAEKHLPK